MLLQGTGTQEVLVSNMILPNSHKIFQLNCSDYISGLLRNFYLISQIITLFMWMSGMYIPGLQDLQIKTVKCNISIFIS